MNQPELDLVRGTLDLLILKTLSWGPMHGLAVRAGSSRPPKISSRSKRARSIRRSTAWRDKGWLDAEWGYTDRNRKAKFYRLTAAGRRHLAAEQLRWSRYTSVIDLVLAKRTAGASR